MAGWEGLPSDGGDGGLYESLSLSLTETLSRPVAQRVSQSVWLLGRGAQRRWSATARLAPIPGGALQCRALFASQAKQYLTRTFPG